MRPRFHVALHLSLLCLGPAGAAADVVVEEVVPGSALEKAGLRPVDLSARFFWAAFELFGDWN